MAYSKNTWTNSDLPAISADNLNHIEDGIETAHENIDNITNNSLPNLTEYSTDEVNTGKKWINDKPIYRKVINFGALPNASDKFVSLDINNLDTIIFLYGLAKDTLTGNYFPLPNATTAGSPYLIDFAIANGNGYTNAIRIRTQNDRTNFTAYIIVEYTKTTDEAVENNE